MLLKDLLQTKLDVQVSEVVLNTTDVGDTYLISYEFHSGADACDMLGGTLEVTKELLDRLEIPYKP